MTDRDVVLITVAGLDARDDFFTDMETVDCGELLTWREEARKIMKRHGAKMASVTVSVRGQQ